MQVGLKAAYDCVRAFSETDFTDDLRAVKVPMLIAHGDDDQIVPIDASAKKAVSLVEKATLKVYPRAPHGIARAVPASLRQGPTRLHQQLNHVHPPSSSCPTALPGTRPPVPCSGSPVPDSETQ
jgi:pimeloyl-ACP methyl ester carboxylesterase